MEVAPRTRRLRLSARRRSITAEIFGITFMGKLTSKGQVTIPKRIRQYLSLGPGSEVDFECAEDGRVVLKTASRKPKSRFAAVRGTLGPGMSTDELMALTGGCGEPDYDVK